MKKTVLSIFGSVILSLALLLNASAAGVMGVDVSKWQEDINWEKARDAGVEFAVIRCGYGADLVSNDDKWWKRNADECTRLGIPF